MKTDGEDKTKLIQQRMASLELDWQFRYRRCLSNANVPSNGSNDGWFKLLYLSGDFTTHCTSIVKQIVNKEFSLPALDPFDHRFILKLNSESIYFKDNIVIRIARIVVPGINGGKDECNIDAQLLYQEYMANDIINDILINMFKNQGGDHVENQIKKVKFHVPLCCLVEYMGYRAFCQADSLFHGFDTVAYGPISENEFRANERVQRYLFQIGKVLNLKPYKVVTSAGVSITIPFSLKCQVHFYKSQKYQAKMKNINPLSELYDAWHKNQKREEYYIYGLSQLWPHYVDKGLENNVGWLRPEILKIWPKALDNSAFIGVSSEKDEYSELQLADACKTVQDELTKMFAEQLDKGETKYFAPQLGASKIFLIDSQSVISAFHQRGINLRFMGAVAEQSQMTHIKTILKMEMAAKVLKNIFYTMIDASDPNDKFPNVNQNLTDFLNLVFSLGEQSKLFFTQMVYPRIAEYFQFVINEFPLQVPGGGLLHALMFHLGVDIHVIDYAFYIKQEKPIFTTYAVKNFVASAMGYRFEQSEPKIVSNLHKSTAFSRQDTKEMRQNKLSTKAKELSLLVSYHKAQNNPATAPKGPLPQSLYLAELADICTQLGRIDQAYEYANEAIKYIPEKHARLVIPLCVIIKYHSINKRLIKSLEFFDKALASITYHLGSNHPLYTNVYNTMGKEYLRHNQADKCEKILKKSLQICSLTFGYLHRSYSDILMILSKLPLLNSVTVGYLTQALTILESTEATDQQIQEISGEIAQRYQLIGEGTSMLFYAKKSGSWTLQIRAAHKTHDPKLLIELCDKPLTGTVDVLYLVRVCFEAYLRISNRQAVSRLYKVYIALQRYKMDPSEIVNELINDLQGQGITVTRLVDECINSMISNYVQMVSNPDFYLSIGKLVPRLKDFSIKRAFRVYLSIISLFTEDQITQLFRLYI